MNNQGINYDNLPPAVRRLMGIRENQTTQFGVSQFEARDPNENIVDALVSFGSATVTNPIQSIRTLAGAMFGAGIIDPLQAAIDLVPGDQSEALAAIERFQQGMYTDLERSAMKSGMNGEEYAAMLGFGKIVGYMAPAVAGYGITSTALRGASALRGARMARVALMRTPATKAAIRGISRFPLVGGLTPGIMVGGLTTETLAGALTEGVLMPLDDNENRFSAALHGAAMFGVGRIVMNAGVGSIRHLYDHNISRSETLKTLVDNAKRTANARILSRAQELKDDVLAVFNESDAMMASPEALKTLFDGGDNHVALAVAIRDQAVNQGRTRGVMNLIPKEGQTPDQILTGLKDRFPNWQFQTVENGFTKRTEVHFSLNRNAPLSNESLRSIRETGFFRGQHVRHDQGSGIVKKIFVKKIDDKPTTVLNIIDDMGNSKLVPRERVLQTFGSAPASADDLAKMSVVSTSGMKLADEFELFIDRAQDLARSSTHELSSAQLRSRAIRQTFKIDDTARRSMQVPGTIYYPEQLGRINNWTPEQVQQVTALTEKIRNLQSQIPRIKPNDEGKVLIKQLEQELAETQLQLARTQVLSGETIARQIAEEPFNVGTVGVHSTPQDMAIGAYADDFLTRRGITQDVFPEYDALKGGIIREYLARKLVTVPRKLAQDLSKAILRQQELDVGSDLNALAAQRGFQFFSNPQQTRFMLRDMISGNEFVSDNVNDIVKALYKVNRETPDLVGNVLPMLSINAAFNRTNRAIPDHILSKMDNYEVGSIFQKRLDSKVRTLRSRFNKIEEMSGIPLARVVESVTSKFTKNGVIAEEVRDVLSKTVLKPLEKAGIDLEDVRVAWARLAEKHPGAEIARLSEDDLIKSALDLGVDKKVAEQLRNLDRFLTVMDRHLQQTVENGSYRQVLADYLTKIKPFFDEFGALPEAAQFGRENDSVFTYLLNNAKRGRIPRTDGNLAIVLDRFIQQSVMFDPIRADIQILHGLKKLRFGQLSAEQQQAIQATRNYRISDDAYVFHSGVREMIDQFAHHYEFTGKFTITPVIKMLASMFNSLGVQSVDEQVIYRVVSTTTELLYGSTLGFRSSPVVLNSLQVPMLGAPLWGGESLYSGYRMAVTREGYEGAKAAGVHAPLSRIAQYMTEDIPDAFVRDLAEDASDPTIRQVLTRMASKGVDIAKAVGQKGLLFFTSIDEFNRTVSYWAQRDFTERAMARLGGSRKILANERLIGELKDEISYFAPNIVDSFVDQLRLYGDESALQFIGREGAIKVNFAYGQKTGPAFTQEGFGRIFGMFGSYPIWYVDYLQDLFMKSSPRVKARFAAQTALYLTAISNMSAEYDFDPHKFLPYSAFGWTGNPGINMLGLGIGLARSPANGKMEAAMNLAKTGLKEFPIPGMLAAKNFSRLVEETYGLEDPKYVFMSTAFGRTDYSPLGDYDFSGEYGELQTEPLDPEIWRKYGNPTMPDLIQGIETPDILKGYRDALESLPQTQQDMIQFGGTQY